MADLSPKLSTNDALVVVDVQNDFCPGGALAVEQGDRVVPILNRWIERAQGGGAVITASRDWHPADHVSFTDRGGPWPVHCVEHTSGAAYHPDLRLPEQTIEILKGRDANRDQYSAFDDTGLGEQLRERDVRRVWVGGLALDVCVRASVLDALDEGFEVHLIRAATRAVNANPGDGERAIDEMKQAGTIVEESDRDE